MKMMTDLRRVILESATTLIWMTKETDLLMTTAMVAMNMHKTQIGVETGTLMNSSLKLCAAPVMVVSTQYGHAMTTTIGESSPITMETTVRTTLKILTGATNTIPTLSSLETCAKFAEVEYAPGCECSRLKQTSRGLSFIYCDLYNYFIFLKFYSHFL